MKNEQEMQEWRKAVEYVRNNRATLRERYGNNYLALSPEGKVADNDRNKFVLSRRVSKDYPKQYFAILSTTESPSFKLSRKTVDFILCI